MYPLIVPMENHKKVILSPRRKTFLRMHQITPITNMHVRTQIQYSPFQKFIPKTIPNRIERENKRKIRRECGMGYIFLPVILRMARTAMSTSMSHPI
jgi:hypothetical protein